MSIPVPLLDDRTFADLVAAALERIRQSDPEWTDLTVHDPGVVLVEAFAHLTDMLMYRLNRLPERLYAVYLNLLGTGLRPPSAATTTVRFTRTTPDGPAVRIPRGTRVAAPPGVPGIPQPVFSTLSDAVLAPGQREIEVSAADLTMHDGVVVGIGSGQPGQVFTIAGAPLVDGPGLSIGIQVAAGSEIASGEAILLGDRTFRLCREVEVFADAHPGEPVVRVDRTSGLVVFPWWSPDAATGFVVPAAGAEVRGWYRRGGGDRGNVAAGTLTVLRDPLETPLQVTNPEPATGGRDVEALATALRRAPQDFQARDRAVTARDYETLAIRHAAVARAKALTRRDVWAFAEPGEIEVVLIPHLSAPDPIDHRIRLDQLEAAARAEVLAEVDGFLRDRATIGATPVVHWGRYKQVQVNAAVVVRQDEDPDGVRARIVRRLCEAISPLPDSNAVSGAGFGRSLRVSNLYRALEQAEPGVLYVDRVELELDQVPDTDAVALTRADGQPGSWFVGQRDTVFRTINGGDGWETCGIFPGETVRAFAPFQKPAPGRSSGAPRPGLVALTTTVGDASRVYVSQNLGENWQKIAELGFTLADLTWIDRSGDPILLVAGEKGLYELSPTEGAVPVQNLVDAAQPDRGFYAVDSFVDVRGRTGVLVAAEAAAGVYLSADGGAPESFQLIRTPGEDVRCISVQYDGPATYIWLGRAVPEGLGTGCLRLRVDDLARSSPADFGDQWVDLSQGWTGGSCWGVAVIGDAAYAASQSGGVLRLPLAGSAPTWDQRDVNSGLPLRDRSRFVPVRSVSGAVADDGAPMVLAAGPRGVVRSVDAAQTWRSCSERRVSEVVTVPPTWLFCSGEHRIEVRRASV